MKNSRYETGMGLDEAVRITLMDGILPIKTLSAEIGYPVYAMEKAISADKESGINLRMLEKIMKCQIDYTILECMAQECGFKIVPVPEGKRTGIPDPIDCLSLIAKTNMELSRYAKGKYSEEDLKDLLCRVMMMCVRSMMAIQA